MGSNSSIAKNTLFLYFRMILIMGVQLYTVRVVLDILGIVDYGIFNVVAGVVAMFSFLSSTMANASQRFFSYEIGQGNTVQLNRIFSLTLFIYIVIALIILILAETIGLWFLNNKLIIPPERIVAANWVYQFSILSFMVKMFQVPYDAIVIARERMNVYAYVSIIEVILKLFIVYLLSISYFDKLVTYGFLILIVTLIITIIYRVYCVRYFKECHYRWFWNKNLFKKIISYSGWNLFGVVAGIANNYGVNIVLNLFFGPTVNAARSIAFQINTSINGFVQNFMTASRPQIVKLFAKGDTNQMMNLVLRTSKFSFFLLYFLSLPIFFKLDYVLSIWLGQIPPHTVIFTKITILTALIESLSYSLMAAFQATGKIKIYQIVVGGCIMLNLPLSFLLLHLGYPAITPFVTALAISLVSMVLRLFLLKGQIKEFKILDFSRRVYLPILIVVSLSSSFMYFLSINIDFLNLEGMMDFMVFCILSAITTILFVYSIGMTKEEREFVHIIVKKKLLNN